MNSCEVLSVLFLSGAKLTSCKNWPKDHRGSRERGSICPNESVTVIIKVTTNCFVYMLNTFKQ